MLGFESHLLGALSYLSPCVSQFPHPSNGIIFFFKVPTSRDSWEKLHELIHASHLEQCLAHRQC